MVNYNNGKIYKIQPKFNGEEGDVYIGSTTKQLLCQRMAGHKQHYRRHIRDEKASSYTVFQLFDKYGFHNCEILLLENVDAKSKDELYLRERYYIDNIKCINKIKPMSDRRLIGHMMMQEAIEWTKEK